MVKVVKRDGSQQEFDRSTIAGSIVKAGACEELGWKIANKIKAEEGKPTTKIAEEVVAELKKYAKETAKAFEKIKTGKEKLEVEKIGDSLVLAGVCPEISKKVVEDVKITEGMSMEEVTNTVSEALREYVRGIARAYTEYKKEKLEAVA